MERVVFTFGLQLGGMAILVPRVVIRPPLGGGSTAEPSEWTVSILPPTPK